MCIAMALSHATVRTCSGMAWRAAAYPDKRLFMHQSLS